MLQVFYYSPGTEGAKSICLGPIGHKRQILFHPSVWGKHSPRLTIIFYFGVHCAGVFFLIPFNPIRSIGRIGQISGFLFTTTIIKSR